VTPLLCAAMLGAIDVGGTKLLAAVEVDGRLGPLLRRRTPAEDPIGTLAAMLDEVRGGAALEGIAMAVPGPFERAAGSLVDPPGMPRTWWGLRLRDELGRLFDCDVVVENDANCAAVAEAAVGAAAGLRSSVYMTVSTGIGVGIVIDGRLVYGRHDTEAGHMVVWPRWLGGPPCHCGGHGCLEALASGLSIERRFGRRGEDIDDPSVWDDVGRWLGLGVVNLAATLDCEAVVLGGGVVGSADRFWPAMATTVEESLFLVPQPRLLRGTLGDARNLIGALAVLRQGHPAA
jgi:glucokinase